jgi:glutaredoxin
MDRHCLCCVQLHKMICAQHIVLFSKSYCRYSREAKRLLAQYTTETQFVELDALPDIQAALADITRKVTVPQCFFNGEFMGGADDLARLDRQGKLKGLIVKALGEPTTC